MGLTGPSKTRKVEPVRRTEAPPEPRREAPAPKAPVAPREREKEPVGA